MLIHLDDNKTNNDNNDGRLSLPKGECMHRPEMLPSDFRVLSRWDTKKMSEPRTFPL